MGQHGGVDFPQVLKVSPGIMLGEMAALDPGVGGAEENTGDLPDWVWPNGAGREPGKWV